MGAFSKIFSRPFAGYYLDADVKKAEVSNNGAIPDGPLFNVTSHGYLTADNIQFLEFFNRDDGTGTTDTDREANPKYLTKLGYRGNNVQGGADGITVVTASTFRLGVDNNQGVGSALGHVVKPQFRSDWIAAFNPYLYIFERSDDKITLINDNGGDLRATFNTLLVADFNVGDKIFIRDHWKYNALFTHVSETGSPAVITFAEPFVRNNGFAQAIHNRKFANYRLEVQIYDSLTDLPLLANPIVYQSPNDGVIEIDLSPFLKTLFDFESNHPLSTLSSSTPKATPDFGRFRQIYIGTLEKWDGSSEVEVKDDTEFEGFAVAAVQTPGDRYGSNLADYVPNEARTGDQAKFLQLFDRPRIWRGYPFSLHWIFDNDLAGNTTHSRVRFADAFGQTVAANSVQLLDAWIKTVVRIGWRMDDITDAVKTAEFEIGDGSSLTTIRSETLIADVLEPGEFPIYIGYVNSKSGDSYELFDYNYSQTFTGSKAEQWERVNRDLWHGVRTKGQSGRKLKETYSVTARSLTQNQFETLSEIMSSPAVWIITQIGTSTEWRRRGILPISNSHDKNFRDNLTNLEMKFEIGERAAQN